MNFLSFQLFLDLEFELFQVWTIFGFEFFFEFEQFKIWTFQV
jgi:hypothetical protein